MESDGFDRQLRLVASVAPLDKFADGPISAESAGTALLDETITGLDGHEQSTAQAQFDVRRNRLSRRHLVLGLVATLIATTVVVRLTLLNGRSSAPPGVTVVRSQGEETILLSHGATKVSELRAQLVAGGHGAFLTPAADGATELNASLIVGPGARLVLDHEALLLRSDNSRQVSIQVRGGTLALRHSTIVSWNGSSVDTKQDDGRAEIMATGQGSIIDIDHSAVKYLGFSADHPGLSWGSGARGIVDSSTFDHDYRGASSASAGRLVIRGSTFSHSTEDGLRLSDPAPGTSVSSSTLSGNAATGFEVDGGSRLTISHVEASDNTDSGLSVSGGHGLTVDGILAHGNSQSGVALANVSEGKVTASKLWSNTTGIEVAGGRISVSDTDLSGNSDGMAVSLGGTAVALDGMRLDHNSNAGVRLSGGNTIVRSSIFDSNLTALQVQTAGVGLDLRNSTVKDSVKDALSLMTLGNIVVEDNRILGSGDAVFSTPKTQNVDRLATANNVAHGQKIVRVRGS